MLSFLVILRVPNENIGKGYKFVLGVIFPKSIIAPKPVEYSKNLLADFCLRPPIPIPIILKLAPEKSTHVNSSL